ncbi:hypothetical protein [Pleurocapsa sp. PCC 7319]|uniref:hypothetical protein n=1 Tax=Pleurocapsa sp. PCC 7319 TaxID=118161 RepID=UPI000477CE5B|nr:hypothetical protein [Pleurocapsa sp. PCC 7319]
MKIYSLFRIPILITASYMTTTPVIAGLFDRPDFFEQGRDQFDEEIRRFEQEQTVPNSNLTIDDTSLPWSRVVIREAGFTAMMPSGSITHEVETVEASKGVINFDIIATHPSSSRYVIAYSEEVTPERVKNAQEVLERSRDYIIDNKVGLNKIADDDITFKDYPGKQFQLQNKDETIVFRLILVKQRLYVLAVNQQNDAISPQSIDTFFSSFELIK